MAKFLDDNGLLYFWQKIKTVFATQSALSDLADTVDGIISEGGEPNTIDTVKVNGSALTPDGNKAVNITIAQGSANGTLAVNGSDVSVKGLGSAAYTASTAYDASGAAAAVLGTSSDAATANTVYGAKAAAAAAQSDVDALESLVGSTAVATQISNAIGGLDSSIAAETNKAIASMTITNGKITASTKVTVPTNNNQLTNGAGYQTAEDVEDIVEGYGYSTTTGTVTSVKIQATSPIAIDDSNAITSSGTRTITHAASGVTAGTYKSVTVNATGHVTGGTNPTTLSGYGITDAYTKTQTDTAIATAVGGITGVNFEIVQTLPASGAAGTIYLVSNSGTGTNSYDEYIWVSNKWEKIGTTDVDLSNYWNTTNLVAITNAEIDTILAA